MDITLNLFCTFHDKRDCHRQQQNKLAFIRRGKKSVSDFRPSKCGYQAEEQFKEKQNNNNKKRVGGWGGGGVGMAQVLIPEGGLHSSRY